MTSEWQWAPYLSGDTAVRWFIKPSISLKKSFGAGLEDSSSRMTRRSPFFLPDSTSRVYT